MERWQLWAINRKYGVNGYRKVTFNIAIEKTVTSKLDFFIKLHQYQHQMAPSSIG